MKLKFYVHNHITDVWSHQKVPRYVVFVFAYAQEFVMCDICNDLERWYGQGQDDTCQHFQRSNKVAAHLIRSSSVTEPN